MSVRPPRISPTTTRRPGTKPASSSSSSSPATTSTTAATATLAVDGIDGVDGVDDVQARGRRAATTTSAQLTTTTAAQRLGSACVVGGGPTGLAQAALLLKRAKDVGLTHLTVVEKREEATRPVGLFFRQATLDALSWLDAESYATLAKSSGLVGPDGKPQGFVGIRLGPGGEVVSETRRTPEHASPPRFVKTALDPAVPMAEVADAMFQAPTTVVVTMRELEDVLWASLPRLAAASGVTLDIRRGAEAEITPSTSPGGAGAAPTDLVDVVIHDMHTVQRSGRQRRERTGKTQTLKGQGLVIVTEGAGARVRSGLQDPQGAPAVTSTATAPSQRFVVAALEGKKHAGAVNIVNASSWTNPKTGVAHNVRVSQGVHAENGLRWTTVSVPDEVEFDASDVAAHKRAVDDYFTQHARVVGDPTLKRDFGPGVANISGAIVDHAVVGSNLVLAGDVVGTSHFKAAGGAATGITTHVASVSRFLDAVAQGQTRAVALAQLDRDLRTSTLAWALHGLPEFTGDPWQLRERYLPQTLLAPLLPPSLLERYWPASGGAPSDEASPWTAWFKGASPPPSSLTPPEVSALLGGLTPLARAKSSTSALSLTSAQQASSQPQTVSSSLWSSAPPPA
jgi:2-polyprenyl-6-methoxyphenol hydroxylase-like FAD-dependent oxidoreductase